MPRYFVPLSEQEFENKIIEIVKSYVGKHDTINNINDAFTYLPGVIQNYPITNRNSEKVYYIEFDVFEIKSIVPDLIGYHVYPNGLTAWGIVTGDGPLVFIILYWDGESIRIYIPTDGNLWNTDTNVPYTISVPPDEDDAENIKKRFNIIIEKHEDWYKLDLDQSKLEQDIVNEFKLKDN